MAKASQDLENLAYVVSKALGGSSDKGKPPAQDLPPPVQNWNELAGKFKALGGMIG